MAVNVVELAEFYNHPLGAYTARQLCAAVSKIWPQPATAKDMVLGYGYATPLAVGLWPHTVWHLLMPAQQGVMANGSSAAERILTDEHRWPLRDDSANRLLVLHGLEAANHLDAVLFEAWRVLRPNGRALFIVPNRAGSWAQRDKTPFGAGRPFSGRQLRHSLRDCGLVPGQMRPALMLPPFVPVGLMASLHRLEALAALIAPQLAGVWLVEAVKQVPAPKRAARARAQALVGAAKPALSSNLVRV